MSKLNVYKHFLARCEKIIECHQCAEQLLPKELRNHLQRQHGLKLSCICPWCLQFNYKNNSDELQNATHRMECLRSLTEQHRKSLKKFKKQLKCRFCAQKFLPSNAIEHVQTCHPLAVTSHIGKCLLCASSDCNTEGCIPKLYGRRKNCSDIYRKHKSQYTTTIKCVKCSERMAPADYVHHINEMHAVSVFLCPWCEQRDETEDIDYNHRLDCMKKFVNANAEINNQKLKLCTKTDTFYDVSDNIGECSSELYLNCQDCDNWRREQGRIQKTDGIYENIEVSPETLEELRLVRKSSSTRNVMAQNEIEFLSSCGIETIWFAIFQSDQYKFYHIMVQRDLWDTFSQIARNEKEIIFLPYWCLCNGGSMGIHRHMMICVRKMFNTKAFFRQFRSSKRQFTTKFVNDDNYFMNAIHYVSNKSSICQKIDLDSPKTTTTRGNCHYYINKPIMPHSRMMMALLLNNGLMVMSTTIAGHKKIAETILSFPDESGEIQETVKNGYIHLQYIHAVREHIVPIKNNFKFVKEVTNYKLALGNNAYRCYEKINDISSPMQVVEFNKFRANEGSMMFDFARNSFHKLTRTQKDILEVGYTLKNQMDILSQELTDLKEKLQQRDEALKERDERIITLLHGIAPPIDSR